MKVLFSADEHLVLRRKGVPKEWEISRFKQYHKKIREIIEKEKIDVMIHGGDFFDREPNWQEIVLAFSEHFNQLPIPTYVIDGNHEASRKGSTFLSSLKSLCGNMNVQFIDECNSIKGIDFIPYCKLKQFANKEIAYVPTSNILVTHVRGAIEPHVVPEVDLSIFDPWTLVLAGDLHDRSNSQRNIMYPGSPMTTHAYRDESVKKGVLIVDTDTLECKFVSLDLPKILRKTVTSVALVVQNGVDYIDYEVVLPSLLEDYEKEPEELAVRTTTTRVDALAEVLEGNPLKEEVLKFYVDLAAHQNT